MYTEDKKDQVVMWILLIIILSNTPDIHIVNSKILGIYQDKLECVKDMDKALSLKPPPNTNVGCLKLRGVKHTDG